MRERTIDEVYSRNAAIRAELKEVVNAIDDRHHDRILDGEKWSVANIVEHLTMVEASAIRICSKLLSKANAEGKPGNGIIKVSNDFVRKGIEVNEVKIEAPDVVRPTGRLSVSDSYAVFDEQEAILNKLRSDFEEYEPNEHRFPHPYFGGLTAGEWLILIGAHEARHLKQIRELARRM